MSTNVTSQDMASMNEESNFTSPENQPVKRKRGRPRKSESPGLERVNKAQSVSTNPTGSSTDGLVGQPVSGHLDGAFDCGYLLTVRVGPSGPVFKGMVFEPGRSVPVTAENDIAPHLPMQQRVDVMQMVGEQNQAAASRSPQASQRTDTSIPSATGHMPEGSSDKVPVAPPMHASEGITDDADPSTQNEADALQSELLKLGNVETTTEKVTSDPGPQAALEPNQSENNTIPNVFSSSNEGALPVTAQGSEAHVGEGVQASSDIEVGLVEVAKDAHGTETSDDIVLGKEIGSEVPDSLGLGAQLQTNASPKDQIKELQDLKEQTADTDLPTSEAMTSHDESGVMQTFNQTEVGMDNQPAHSS